MVSETDFSSGTLTNNNTGMVAALAMRAGFIPTLRLNRALQFVFASLTILFFLLAIGDACENAGLKRVAGYEGILCGLSAIYAGLAQVLNEVFGRTVLPLRPVKK